MFDRIRAALGSFAWRSGATPWLMKATGIQMLPGWVKDPIRDFTIKTVIQHGYLNSAVYACIRVLAESFPEPELHVYDTTPEGESVIIADHPLRQLLARPNPYMAEDEFWEFAITYAALGGNFYLWKERNQLGQVISLWPFHDGQLRPILHPTRWISGYTLDVDTNGQRERLVIPPEDIIHWRWSVDPRQPQIGLSPIVAASRVVDMDSEYLRYQHALAHNDAVPRTIIKTRLGYNDEKLKQLKDQWKQRFGGDNRGDVAILNDPDAEIMRIGSNLGELAVEAIHNIPESRIAAVFGGAPVGYLAGLNVHLQRSTFSNYEAAELALHRRVLMAKWRSVEGAMTAGLLPEFLMPETQALRFDTSRVAALAGERQAREAHALAMYVGGVWSRGEARAASGQRALAEDVILEPASALPSAVVYAIEPVAQKAKAGRGRVDVSAVRQGLQARRVLAAEFEREIAAALKEEQEAVLHAVAD